MTSIPDLAIAPQHDASRARRRSSILAWTAILIAWSGAFWSASQELPTEQVVNVSVRGYLHGVGDYVCARNRGLDRIVVYTQREDYYGFVCTDGATFHETVRLEDR